MAARKLKWNRLVSAGSFDERASTSAWNVSRQGLRVFPGYKAEVEVVAETNGLVPVFLEVLQKTLQHLSHFFEHWQNLTES